MKKTMGAKKSEYHVAWKFSPFLDNRLRVDGECSGEEFREDVLVPKLQEATSSRPVVLNFDGVEGVSDSWIEEVFGGLVSVNSLTAAELRRHLRFNSEGAHTHIAEGAWERIDAANSVKFGK